MGHLAGKGLNSMWPWILGAATIVLCCVGVWLWRFRKNPRGLPRSVLGWVGGAALLMVGGLGAYVGYRYLKLYVFGQRWSTHAQQSLPPLHFRLTSSEGERTLEQYRGKVVLLNEWATWCSPCKQELPELERLAKTYAGRGLEVIALSEEPVDVVRSFVEGRDAAAWAGVFLNPSEVQVEPFARSAHGIPFTLLLDGEGRLRDFFMGAQPYETFERAVAPLIGDARATD